MRTGDGGAPGDGTILGDGGSDSHDADGRLDGGALHHSKYSL